ncbi:hypothetical protein [Streptomonospora litoralis]|uniref:Integral membrane protein n=1 Tax=Streptomonospora litoralis TaxID=2498135 RepID=A0A4P6Q887_9ACTN|nr:hypothetical protein [Streptomonospora litoralis]QBI56640.1 hypothetical protein EKD16_24480 [Streptomonospora litoralis]
MAQQRSASPYLWALRVTALVQLALLAVEFATAGQLVMQDMSVLGVHAGTAIAVHVTAGAQLIAAALLVRPGGGPVWPAVVSAAAFGLGFAQAYFGSHMMLGLHVPTALLLVVLVMAVLAASWLPALRNSGSRDSRAGSGIR